MQRIHYSVMKQEVLTHLVPLSNSGTVVDCTLGAGGHSEALLATYPGITVIGIDRDRGMVDHARHRLAGFGPRFTALCEWFDDALSNFPKQFPQPQCILMDLGISTYHYEGSKRGFSLHSEEDLDMRLDLDQELTAGQVVNTYREQDLADILYRYGEERYSRRIAKALCEARPVRTAKEVRDVVYRCVPPGYRRGRIHPATKTFQALRIEVNSELPRIRRGIEAAVELLCTGGRIGVISFHSLEDRITKQMFRLFAGRAPADEQNSQHYRDHPSLRLITKKPITPSREELHENQASRSAKFRVAEKIGGSI